MADRLFVKVIAGCAIRDPRSKQLFTPELYPDGFYCELDTFWSRRLRDGSIVKANPPSVDAPAPDVSAPKSGKKGA